MPPVSGQYFSNITPITGQPFTIYDVTSAALSRVENFDTNAGSERKHVYNAFDINLNARLPNGIDTDTAADWLRNDFDGQGLPSFPQGGTPKNGEAINTPGTFNAEGQTPPAPPGLLP